MKKLIKKGYVIGLLILSLMLLGACGADEPDSADGDKGNSETNVEFNIDELLNTPLYHTTEYRDGDATPTELSTLTFREKEMEFSSYYLNTSYGGKTTASYEIEASDEENSCIVSYDGKFEWFSDEESGTDPVAGKLKLKVIDDGLVEISHVSGDLKLSTADNKPMVFSKNKEDKLAVEKIDITSNNKSAEVQNPESGKQNEEQPKQQNSSSYDPDYLAERAHSYYAAEYGYTPQYSEIDYMEGNIVAIHIYDIIDEGTEYEHTATCDWYYINRLTGEGTNLAGEPIDLR